MDIRIHLPDYSFSGKKEQGSLQFVAALPCLTWYQQKLELDDLAAGAGVGERLRGWILAALEREGTLSRFDTALTRALSEKSARMLAAAEDTLF